jgi:hypothetical protein
LNHLVGAVPRESAPKLRLRPPYYDPAGSIDGAKAYFDANGKQMLGGDGWATESIDATSLRRWIRMAWKEKGSG